MDAIAGCFARRETRATAAEMVTGLLAKVDTRNCWTLAEALGHPGPHRLQHLLSRARFDHDRAREEIARLVIRELAGQEVVLVADETGDAKSSTDCVGAGRQYSGAIKGVGLCQVAVHLPAVTESRHRSSACTAPWPCCRSSSAPERCRIAGAGGRVEPAYAESRSLLWQAGNNLSATACTLADLTGLQGWTPVGLLGPRGVATRTRRSPSTWPCR